MPSDGQAPGSKTADRLAERLDRSQLKRQEMPGGGAVYRGPTATRALDALGARAMTVDRQVVVGEDFDPSRREDQALYAHERYHAERGDGAGGGGGENFRDSEEIAARAVERMVLHRMDGDSEAADLPGAGSSDRARGAASHGLPGSAAGGGGGPDTPDAQSRNPSASRGYQRMLQKGMSRADIVEELARRALAALDEQTRNGAERHKDKRGTFSSN